MRVVGWNPDVPGRFAPVSESEKPASQAAEKSRMPPAHLFDPKVMAAGSENVDPALLSSESTAEPAVTQKAKKRNTRALAMYTDSMKRDAGERSYRGVKADVHIPSRSQRITSSVVSKQP